MALTVCTECNDSISTQAKICPHCGFPLQKASTVPIKIFGYFLITAAVVIVTLGVFKLYDLASTKMIKQTDVSLSEDEYVGIPVSLDRSKKISINYQVKAGPNIDVYFVDETTFFNWKKLDADVRFYRDLSREKTHGGNIDGLIWPGRFYLVFDNTDRGTIPPVNMYDDQVIFDYQIKLR